jgi:DNA topoisomerase III
MVFTSVAGHLTELDFPASHKGWRSCSPLDLFAAPVHKTVPGVSHSRGAGVWQTCAPQ